MEAENVTTESVTDVGSAGSSEDFEIGGVSIAKMKVTDLKNELDSRGLNKAGKKEELVSRLISFMAENERGNTSISKMEEDTEPTDESAATKSAEEGKMEKDKDSDSLTGNGEAKSGKSGRLYPWHRDGGVKRAPLPKAVQKRRNNARIRKLVAPKPPTQILNELVGPGNVASNIMPSKGVWGLVTAEVNVEGKKFTGAGPNKEIAKNIAAETAIHHIATTSMAAVSGDSKGQAEGTRSKFEDSTPWGALASLALFKLFSDWQAGGYALPRDMCSKELGRMVGPVGLGMGAPGTAGMGGTWSNQEAVSEDEEMMVQEEGFGKEDGFGDFTDDAGTYNEFGISESRNKCFKSDNVGFRGRGRGFGMGGFGGIGKGRGFPGPFPGTFPGFPGFPAQVEAKHPVSLLNEKLGNNAKMEYVFSEAGDTPIARVYTCTLNLGQEAEAQYVERKGSPVGVIQGQAKSKKEAKRLAAVAALAMVFDLEC